jgi:hypothetical protein
MFRKRSIVYLACTLRQLIQEEAKGNTTRWTWQQCLQYSIRVINDDLGMEAYSNEKSCVTMHVASAAGL